MAEPVGTTLGALGILGLLSVSLDCFNFIQDGMSLVKDFAHIDGQLSILRVRLYAWGKACGFLRGQEYDKRLDSPEWQAHIRTQLSSISLLFLDADKIVDKYHVGQTYEPRTTNQQHFVDQGLRDYLARVAMTKTKAGLTGQFQWALVYKRRMTELVQRLRECIEALELVSRYPDLFETRDLMIRQEVGMVDDVRSLRNMITAESGAGIVSDAASERLSQLERIIPPTNRVSSSNCASPSDCESSSDSESSGNAFPATREDANVVRVTLPPSSETVNGITMVRTRSGATREVVIVPTLPEAVREAHAQSAKKRLSTRHETRQTWNQLDPVTKQVLQQIVVDTVLGDWHGPAKDIPRGPFSSLRYLLSFQIWRVYSPDIMSRFEQVLPGEDPEELFRGTLAEMDIPTEDELWASMQPLFHTLVQAQQWPQDGVDMLQCQVAELQAPFKIRQHCSLLLQELAKGDLCQLESSWGQFVQHDEYVSFRPRDKETGHVLAMAWLQVFATGTMELELMTPKQPGDGSSALSDAQQLYLRDVDTAEVERLVTCLVDVYASVMMTVKLQTWVTYFKKRLLPQRARGEKEKRAPEQQVRLMAELSLGRSPEASACQLDESDWGTRLAPMLRSDLLWLSENPQWLTGFRGFFGSKLCLIRFASELRRWWDEQPAFMSLRPLRLAVEGSCRFRISFEGPPQSPYQGGIFHLLCDYPLDFPAVPPKIRFLTRVYHPNISPDGQVCVDILSDGWSPVFRSEAFVMAILSLLSDPETVDPLVPEIAATFLQDRPLYERNARLYTMKHAGVDQEYADYEVVPFHTLHDNANAAESMA